jgi:hypothetical protein
MREASDLDACAFVIDNMNQITSIYMLEILFGLLRRPTSSRK